MEYPEHLVPRPFYTRIDTTVIPDGAVFLRRIGTEYGSVVVDELGELSVSTFLGTESLTRMNGLSVNIQGVFRVEDIHIKPVTLKSGGSPDEQWKPGVWLPAVNDVEWEYLTEVTAVRLPFSWWQLRPFPMRDEVELDELWRMSGRTQWTHAPTVTNFWHFELHFVDMHSGDPVRNTKSKWKKKAYEFVLRDALSTPGAISVEAIPFVPVSPAAYGNAS